MMHIAGGVITPNPASYALIATDIYKIVNIIIGGESFDANEKAEFEAFGKIIENIQAQPPEIPYPPNFIGPILPDDIYGDNAEYNKKLKAYYKSMYQTVGSSFDYMSAQIAKRNSTSKSTSAASNITTMKLTGTSTLSTDQGGDEIFFSTPGSIYSKNNPEEYDVYNFDPNGKPRPEYTYYNEILGTFALLYKPVVEKYQTTYVLDTLYDGSYPTQEYRYFRKTQYKVKNYPNGKIQYVFNPAADVNITNTDIKVALEINSNIIKNGNAEVSNDVVLSLTNLPNSKILKMGNYGIDSALVCHSPFVSPDYIGNLSTQIEAKWWEDHWYENQFPIQNTDMLKAEIFLKFLINFEFETIGSDGEPNKAFQIYKYPVEIVSRSTPMPINELNTESIELSETYSENTTFSTIKDVEIVNNLNVSNNSTLTLNIGRNLVVDNDIEINAEEGSKIIINIAGFIIGDNFKFQPNIIVNYEEAPGIPFDHEIPPITDKEYMTNFCLNEYKAKYINDESLEQKNNTANQNNETENYKTLFNKDFTIIPNPNNGSFRLDLTNIYDDILKMSSR